MRRIKTEQIRGRELLAKDIYSASGVVLISEGTILKKEYIEKLLELKITDVFVEDEISKEIRVQDITEEKIREQCSEKLEETMERFSYASGNELKELYSHHINLLLLVYFLLFHHYIQPCNLDKIICQRFFF